MIHSNMRSIREAKGISQTHIADSLGITRQAYSRLELGRIELKAETLKFVANILETPIEVFYDTKLTKSVIRKLKRKVQRNAGTRRKEAG